MNYDSVKDIQSIDSYGKVIYLLGSSEYGAVNTPTKIMNVDQLTNVFGSQGTMIEAYKQIINITTECEIRGVKVTGQHSMLHLDLNIKDQSVYESGLVFKAKYANEIYDNIYITLDDYGMTFYFPLELGGGFKRYQFSDYEILGLLIRSINYDTKAGLNHVWVTSPCSHGISLDGLIYSVNPDEVTLYGGSSGLTYNKNQLYICLAETYDLLESEYIDIILPVGAFLDDLHPRFHYGYDDYQRALFYADDKDYLDVTDANGSPLTYHRQLIDFCKKQMRFGLITHGIMGYNKIPDIADLNNQVYNYIDVINGSPIGDGTGFVKGNDTDDAFFISIVAGELTYSDGTVANGYTAYAALMGSTTIAASLTNKSVPNVSLATVFTTEQLDLMSRIGIVSFRDSVLKGLVISNAVTPVADQENEMHYACNVRMIQLTLSFVKLQLDKFLGEDINKLIKENTIETTLEAVLRHLVQVDILKAYSKTITTNSTTGELRIALGLKTLYMIETFSATAGANFKV